MNFGLNHPSVKHRISTFLIRGTIALAVLAVATAPLWQTRWIEAPPEKVRFEPLRKTVEASELGPESAYGWLRKAEEALEPALSKGATPDPAWKKEEKLLGQSAWSDEAFPKLKESLENNTLALEYLRKAAALPDLVVPTITSMHSNESYVTSSARLSALLRASASRNASRGNFEAMANDLESSMRFAILVSSGGTQINWLVAAAILRQTADCTMILARNYALPAPVSQRLVEAFEKMERELPVHAEVLRCEGRMLLSELEVIYGKRPRTSPIQVTIPAWKAFPALLGGSSLESTRQNTKWFLEHLILMAEQGDNGTRAEKFIIDRRLMFRGNHSFLLIRDPIGFIYAPLFTAGYMGIPQLTNETNSSLRGAALVLAIEQYRRESGSLPSDLAVLVPKFLPNIPMDPDGENAALKFVPLPGDSLDYTVYSIGPNKRDDRGRGPAVKRRPSKLEGDYVIYPPSKPEK